MEEIKGYLFTKLVESVDGLVEWWNSKKTKDALMGSCFVTVMAYLGIDVQYIIAVAGLWGVKIGSQGLADMGKEKAKIEAKTK